MSLPRLALPSLIGLTFAVLCIGCNSNNNPEPSGPPEGAPVTGNVGAPSLLVPPEFASGRKVFDAHNCGRCHSTGGPPLGAGGPPVAGGPPGSGGPPKGGGKMGFPRGPDLAAVGKDPAHTIEWLSEHIRNAKAHKADSRMPPFGEDKINGDDLRKLAEYLASLK